MSFYHKKLILIIILVLGIAVSFWTGSRYPQLNTKALMGADSPSMGISFDVVKEVQPEDSILEKVVYNTINWMDTNKKGMTFGFLFGAAFILLFSLLKDIDIKNRFLNTAIGSIIGAPLGVCVNCAAPIAKGMKDAGAKSETALATMITSPTMNIIVLSMLFAFLPIYMVWLKIGFTLALIFIVIPLVANLFKEKSPVIPKNSTVPIPAFNLENDPSEKLLPHTWMEALGWTFKSYLKSLWFIIKTTLPLMILAGLLGNLLISILPLEDLVDLVKNLSSTEKVVYMMAIALFATFLPVPIAFDVIITTILWSAGLHTRFAMILLFCLGTYSIYSSFVVAKSFSFKLAVLLFFVVAVFGFTAGIFGHYFEKEMGVNYRMENYAVLKASDAPMNYIRVHDDIDRGLTYEELTPFLNEREERTEVFQEGSVRLFRTPFLAKNKSKEKNKFRSIEGLEKGLVVPYQFSVKEVHEPFANPRSIASGDVHNDGYPDLLISSAEDLYLYANINGKEFKAQKLINLKEKGVFNAALVDFNNDGWLDVFVSSYRNGNYIIVNDSARFKTNSIIRLPQLKEMILTISPGFADVNKDGLIDIVLGNWSIGSLGAADYAMKEARNFQLINRGGFKFNLEPLIGADGETLSLLLADFNDDGNTDAIVGNDFNTPDFYYLGAKQGGFEKVNDPEKLVEKSTLTTMSVTTADINNDLISEVLQVQIDRITPGTRTMDINTICEGIQDNYSKQKCIEIFELQQTFLKSTVTKNYEICPNEYNADCIASELITSNSLRGRSIVQDPCSYFGAHWADFKYVCEIQQQNNPPYPRVKEGTYQDKEQGGIFLQKDANGFFKEKTKQYNLLKTGWGWNSKFCDLDNDEWQDLYIVNGFTFQNSQETNIFYRNINGTSFQEQTKDVGLINYLPTTAYTYVDYDLDGDVDIISATSFGPISIYENNFHENNSIAFSIEDYSGNRNGVGAIITIYYGEGNHQKREVLLSGGHKSFDETKVYFGLGAHKQIEKVEVKWRSGESNIINQPLGAGSMYTIVRNHN